MLRACFFTVSFLFLAACSLYESSGHKAIEKNQGGIVTAGGLVASGFGLKPYSYYTCARSLTTPDFLKEPLEVLETPFEQENFSVLLNSQSSPGWLAVYRHQNEFYDTCKIYFLQSSTSAEEVYLNAAHIGVTQLKKFNNAE